ncbi:hypothetical protein ACWC5I_35370 [Kitasatospora sp. NPDC001574]
MTTPPPTTPPERTTARHRTTAPTEGTPVHDTSGVTTTRRTMLAGTVGTVMEWYDFSLYGLASALVFGPLFFGSSGTGATPASVVTALVAAGGSVTPVVLYVIAGCAVTALAVLGGRETARGEIRTGG